MQKVKILTNPQLPFNDNDWISASWSKSRSSGSGTVSVKLCKKLHFSTQHLSSANIERRKQLEEERERNIERIKSEAKEQSLRVAIIADSVASFESKQIHHQDGCELKFHCFRSIAEGSRAQEVNETGWRLAQVPEVRESSWPGGSIGRSRVHLQVEDKFEPVLGWANQLVAEMRWPQRANSGSRTKWHAPKADEENPRTDRKVLRPKAPLDAASL